MAYTTAVLFRYGSDDGIVMDCRSVEPRSIDESQSRQGGTVHCAVSSNVSITQVFLKQILEIYGRNFSQDRCPLYHPTVSIKALEVPGSDCTWTKQNYFRNSNPTYLETEP